MYKFRFLWLLCLLSSGSSFLMAAKGDRLVEREDIKTFIFLVQEKLTKESKAITRQGKPVMLHDIYKLLRDHLFKPEVERNLYQEFRKAGITRNQLLVEKQVNGFILGMLHGTLKKLVGLK